MSEHVSSRGLRFIFNSLLLVSTCFTGQKSDPVKHPFALAACVVGGSIAVLGLLRVLFGSERNPEQFRTVRNVSQSVLELVPLPLINMQLYMLTHGVGPLVLGHFIFVLPLLFDLRCSLMKERNNCDLTETMRDLSTLANIISLGFITVRQHNFLYLRLTLTVTFVKYAPMVLDLPNEEAGEDLLVCGSALLFYLLGKATVLTTE